MTSRVPDSTKRQILSQFVWGGCDYDQIQDAVLAAPPGAEIRIAGGVYRNPDINTTKRLLVVTNEVTLLGDYDGSDWSVSDPEMYPTVLDGEGQRIVLYAETSRITVTVRGLTLQRGLNYGV